MDALDQVFRYHEETKHHFFRYARALGYLDWANQPDPFRRFAGAPLFPLPLLSQDEEPWSPLYEDLYLAGAVAPHPVNLRTLSRFFEDALAISAWKEAGGVRWALRSNPSSGNLHPTEGYVLLPRVPGLAPTPALYHYAPKEHALELRMDCAPELFARLVRSFPPHAFLLGLSSVHWREAWKYGERAFRYCQHDAGHAIGTARIAAATLGWRLALLEGVSDETIVQVLGLNRTQDFNEAEREHPDCLAVVWPAEAARHEARGAGVTLPLFLDIETVEELAGGHWYGRANRLSRDAPVPWPIIDEVAAASWKSDPDPRFVEVAFPSSEASSSPRASGLTPRAGGVAAGRIIRQRRSAVAFDGKTGITARGFFAMLGKVMPHVASPVARRPMPWDAIPWEPRIHLAMFVHLVDGISPGLYLLARDPSKQALLRRAMHGHFLWTPPPGCPEDLPLYLLQEGDARQLASQVSCHQAIAGESAFSLGMVADYEDALRTHGPWFYRRLFWESGLIGQVLYLEAEAAGVRATGIGCFFDDPVHEVFGFKDRGYQSLYHFTTGGPVEDDRLTTLPAYGNVTGEK
jgi:SagB-type dehydrogenase family enzyme